MEKFSLKNYIKSGYKAYNSSKVVKDLTNEEIEELLKSSDFETIKDVLDFEFFTDKYLYEIDYIIDYSLIVDENNSQIDKQSIINDLLEIYPNALTLNNEIIEKYLKEGYTYIFNMSGYDEITEEEKKTDKRYIVGSIGMHGLVSNAGFLDLCDTLFDCVFFDENNNEVDITELRTLYENRWNKKTNKKAEK